MKREAWLLIAGIAGVTTSTGISYFTGNIWAGFFCAIVAGGIYLIFLDRIFVQKLKKPSHKLAIRTLAAGLVTVQLFAFFISYDRSQVQESQLSQTRAAIDEGIAKFRTQEVFLETLKHYYRETENDGATLASSFGELMGNKLHPDGAIELLEPGIQSDIDFIYEIASPDSLIITASAKIGRGENPAFVNVNMQTGKYQAVSTLTPKGIRYEREN